ncbi:MAG: pirin family protein [Thermoplasmata archaeon]|nr:MAG: pirin family protein [Thermoplasmata archaeon]
MDDICRIKNEVNGFSVVDGAGVKLNRIIGSPRLDHIDPFVLLDEFKSDNADDYIRGFPTHPHRGIETITLMIKGSFRHKDSKGNGGVLTDGCVQWMTAGRGILHSEMPDQKEGLLWGYQLWLSLPAKDKMIDPRYQHLSPDMMPEYRGEGLKLSLISGKFETLEGPAKNWVKSNYFNIGIEKDAVFKFEIDKNMNSFCYIHTGYVIIAPSVKPKKVAQGNLVEFENKTIIEIQGGSENAGLLFLSGYPNNEPIVKGGPFVMNTEQEIEQAFMDYHNGVLQI